MWKVLIADDELIVRRAIRRIGKWEEFGMEVAAETEDGLATLAYILDEKPQIVILDMRMPGMSGEEILEQLKEKKVGPHIIVVSGFDSFEYARKALRYGADDYILKPVNRIEFNEILGRISQQLLLEEQDGARREPAGGKRVEQAERDICDKIREDIERNYQQDISTASLAGKFYVNKDVLSRMFKKKFGTGITDYINQVRLEQAKLLLQWGYHVSRTAEMVGYHDVNYFSRIFRKKYDISPTEFIHREQGKDSS